MCGLAIGAFSLWGIQDLRNSLRPKHPVQVAAIEAPFDRVNLGEPFALDLIINKVRDDCNDGRVVRHMLELQRGWHYVVERSRVLQLPLGDNQPFSLNIPTKPLDGKDQDLLRPGLWKMISRVIYTCPEGSVDLVYDSPPFTVLPP